MGLLPKSKLIHFALAFEDVQSCLMWKETLVPQQQLWEALWTLTRLSRHWTSVKHSFVYWPITAMSLDIPNWLRLFARNIRSVFSRLIPTRCLENGLVCAKLIVMERLARLLAALVSLSLSMEKKPKLMILSTIISRARDSKPEVVANHLLYI